MRWPPHSGIRAGGVPAGARYHAVVDGHQRLEGGAQELDPLAVAQGVLLGADDVDVMGDAGGGLVLRAPQAPRGQPGGKGAWRRGAAWGTGAAGDFPRAPRHPPGPAPCVSRTPLGSARITLGPSMNISDLCWGVKPSRHPRLHQQQCKPQNGPAGGWGLLRPPPHTKDQLGPLPMFHVPT